MGLDGGDRLVGADGDLSLVGNGLGEGRYLQVGHLVHFRVVLG